MLCNAITGESVYYDLADIPSWVDNVFTPNLIMEQYDYHGTLVNGFINSILGQRDVNPAIASLIMCLESVFSALGGWLLLHQSLSMREVFGCTLIFAAVVLAQLPVEDWLKCRSASRK